MPGHSGKRGLVCNTRLLENECGIQARVSLTEQGRYAAVFLFLFLQVFLFPSIFFSYFALRATGTAQPLPLTAIDPIRVFRRDFFSSPVLLIRVLRQILAGSEPRPTVSTCNM